MSTSVDADSWSCTQLKVYKLSHLWTIENFTLHFKAETPIMSPTFSGKDDQYSQWQLSLIPTQPGYRHSNYFSLNFARVSKHTEKTKAEAKRKMRVKFEYSILAEYPDTTLPNNPGPFSFHNQIQARPRHSYHYTQNSVVEGSEYEVVLGGNILEADLSQRIQSDGKLNIRLELEVFEGEFIYTQKPGTVFQYSVPPGDLGIQLGSALREGSYADFTLAVGDKKLKAHKVVLAARSPVLKRMIESPMRENRKNRVEITDFDPEVVQELLTYIYTGEAPNLKKMPQELLEIAEKYELKHLKIMCGEVLYHNLNVSNVVDTLLLADLHNIQQLKSACLSFAAAHFSEIRKTTGWSTLKTYNHELYINILETQTAPPPKKKPRLTF